MRISFCKLQIQVSSSGCVLFMIAYMFSLTLIRPYFYYTWLSILATQLSNTVLMSGKGSVKMRLGRFVRQRAKGSSKARAGTEEGIESSKTTEDLIPSATLGVPLEDSRRATPGPAEGDVSVSSHTKGDASESDAKGPKINEAICEATGSRKPEQSSPASARDKTTVYAAGREIQCEEASHVEAHSPGEGVSIGSSAAKLWQQAYESLRSENSERLDRYEDALNSWARDQSSVLVSRHASSTGSKRDDCDSSEAEDKRALMSQINFWLDRNLEDETESPAPIIAVRDHLRLLSQAAPEAASAWTSVYLSLHVLVREAPSLLPTSFQRTLSLTNKGDNFANCRYSTSNWKKPHYNV